MENESYGAFVGIDVDSTLPVFTLGLIGGTEYMDADDSVTVRPRQGLQVFKRAVAFFKTRGVTEVIHCGNVIHSANAGTGTQFTALQDMETERGRLGRARWHFAAGPADVVNFSGAPGGVLGALKASRDESAAAAGRSYYAAFPAAQWRLLVLDAFDGVNPASVPTWGDAPPLAKLGEAQLVWLSAQLSVAASTGEKALLVCHVPIAALQNSAAVGAAVGAAPGVVMAVLSLGDGTGSHHVDSSGIHHLSLRAAADLVANVDAFGVLTVYADTIKLEMRGAAPDASRCPHGWPSELPFAPRGGQLVTSEQSAAWMASFVSFWLVLISTLLAPMSAAMRMLTSNADAGAAAEHGGLDPDAGAPSAGRARRKPTADIVEESPDNV